MCRPHTRVGQVDLVQSGVEVEVGATGELSRRLERRYPGFFGFPSYRTELMRRIESDVEKTPGPVLEVGGTFEF